MGGGIIILLSFLYDHINARDQRFIVGPCLFLLSCTDNRIVHAVIWLLSCCIYKTTKHLKQRSLVMRFTMRLVKTLDNFSHSDGIKSILDRELGLSRYHGHDNGNLFISTRSVIYLGYANFSGASRDAKAEKEDETPARGSSRITTGAFHLVTLFLSHIECRER